MTMHIVLGSIYFISTLILIVNFVIHTRSVKSFGLGKIINSVILFLLPIVNTLIIIASIIDFVKNSDIEIKNPWFKDPKND